MKKIFLLKLSVVFICLFFIGCSSGTPYTPPAEGEPRAYFRVTNNCDFTLYLSIDGDDAGHIYADKSRSFEVKPETHIFEFSGSDSIVFEDDDYPVFFRTQHKFSNSEEYELPVEFGVR